MIKIEIDDEALKKAEGKLGANFLEILKMVGARIEEIKPCEKRRFIVLNKGAHDVETALRRQFGENIEVVYASEGNLDVREVEDVAKKVGRTCEKGDVLVLTGPALLSVLATLFCHAKHPDQVTIAQYDLSSKKYVLYEINHLKIREMVSQKT
ncbi:MAG: hypothetical protein ACP6IP_04310 [Candidatus Njordarchaeia archaeon]